MAYGIGSILGDIDQKADAYRNNPDALAQSYQQNQQLIDLLVLQKLKTDKEAAQRDMQAKMQTPASTIKDQRAQEVMGMTRNEVAQQVTPGLQALGQQMQAAQDQPQAQGIASVPAPNMQQVGMAGGGIIAFADGDLVRKKAKVNKADITTPQGVEDLLAQAMGTNTDVPANYRPVNEEGRMAASPLTDVPANYRPVRPTSTVSSDPVLGTRLNNPLNIRASDNNDWEGETASSGGFEGFNSIAAGLRAADKTLTTYGNKGIETIRGIINRWAPSSENKTEEYLSFVADKLGMSPDDKVDLNDPGIRAKLISIMGQMETGVKNTADDVLNYIARIPGAAQQTAGDVKEGISSLVDSAATGAKEYLDEGANERAAFMDMFENYKITNPNPNTPIGRGKIDATNANLAYHQEVADRTDLTSQINKLYGADAGFLGGFREQTAAQRKNAQDIMKRLPTMSIVEMQSILDTGKLPVILGENEQSYVDAMINPNDQDSYLAAMMAGQPSPTNKRVKEAEEGYLAAMDKRGIPSALPTTTEETKTKAILSTPTEAIKRAPSEAQQSYAKQLADLRVEQESKLESLIAFLKGAGGQSSFAATMMGGSDAMNAREAEVKAEIMDVLGKLEAIDMKEQDIGLKERELAQGEERNRLAGVELDYTREANKDKLVSEQLITSMNNEAKLDQILADNDAALEQIMYNKGFDFARMDAEQQREAKREFIKTTVENNAEYGMRVMELRQQLDAGELTPIAYEQASDDLLFSIVARSIAAGGFSGVGTGAPGFSAVSDRTTE